MILRAGVRASTFLQAIAASPAVASAEMAVLDATLSFLSEQRRYRYRGECGRPGADPSCWTEALTPHNIDLATFTGLPWLYLANTWCRSDKTSNVTLVCPCTPDGADWCPNASLDWSHGAAPPVPKGGAAPHPKSKKRPPSPCNVRRCFHTETIFVKFGLATLAERSPEILNSNEWSCAADHATSHREREQSSPAREGGTRNSPPRETEMASHPATSRAKDSHPANTRANESPEDREEPDGAGVRGVSPDEDTSGDETCGGGEEGVCGKDAADE